MVGGVFGGACARSGTLRITKVAIIKHIENAIFFMIRPAWYVQKGNLPLV